MEIIKLDAEERVDTNLPIPEEGKRPDDEVPLKVGFDKMSLKVSLARLPDPKNIEISAGTGLASIGATNILPLDDLHNNPVSWLSTQSAKLKFVLKATLSGVINKTLAQVLEDHNVIIFNDNVAAIEYGGFLVLTIGSVGSGADIILTEDHVYDNRFNATVIRKSEEF